MDKQQIINVARSWLYTPWKHNQKIKGVGVDCVNFLVAIAEEVKYPIEPIPENYARLPKTLEIKEYLDNNFIARPKEDWCDLEATNILLLEIDGRLCHVAMATSPTTMIHANQRLGRVAEHAIDGIWSNKIRGVYRLLGQIYFQGGN